MNPIQQSYSKEAIKARMLQNATKLWGVKNIQSLDPFVKLLIDAFSTEVFKANNEIQSVNGRITEKLAKMLTPSKYAHPSPAHGIAHYIPSEDKEVLMDHSEFFIKKQIASTQKNQSSRQVEIGFTPIDNVNTIKAQSTLMVAGNTVYNIDEHLNKVPIARIASDAGKYRTMKLGIDITDYSSEVFPEKLTFYCSNPTYENVDFVYRLLPHIKVFYNEKPLAVNQGISYESASDVEGFDRIFEEQSIRQKIKEDVKSIYNNKFIEVGGLIPSIFRKIKKGLPPDIDDGKNIWEPYRKRKYLWLTIEFPPQFTSQVIENFLFILNAFPVYNRTWKKTEYALDIMGNNIPLETSEDEHFLYVEEVLDGQGKKYFEIPFTPTDSINKGLYTVRKGGMERFTNRNATDLMFYIMELLRDEVAAFAVINRDKVKEVLGEISEKMKGLMQKVELADKELRKDINYIIIDPLENSAHTYGAFWVSHCSLGNYIRPGTVLSSQKKFQKVTLLTATTGGEEEQRQSDTILAYKYALTTRDKIISVKDVKNYCKMTLKNQLKSVTVTKGTMISDKPKEGFIRTIDVNIIPQDYAFYGSKYWDKMAEILQNDIKAKAIDGLEYRVVIHEEAVHLEI